MEWRDVVSKFQTETDYFRANEMSSLLRRITIKNFNSMQNAQVIEMKKGKAARNLTQCLILQKWNDVLEKIVSLSRSLSLYIYIIHKIRYLIFHPNTFLKVDKFTFLNYLSILNWWPTMKKNDLNWSTIYGSYLTFVTTSHCCKSSLQFVTCLRAWS